MVFAMAAFIANAHCLANCQSSACKTASSTSKSCHHHENSDGDSARCSHQHSQLAGPEASLGKITLAVTYAVPSDQPGNLFVRPTERSILFSPDTGPPRDPRCGSSVAILRI